MGLSEAVKTVIGKYADFSGRARRSEYWYWLLALFLAELVFVVLAQVSNLFMVLLFIAYLGVIVPSIAVAVRRLHDTGKSGWYLLIGLIPIVGGIIMLVFMASDGTPGDNAYGPNPKGLGGAGMAPMGYGPPPTV